MNPGTLFTFSAVRIVNGSLRRLWFEATGEPEAREFCASINAGFEGPGDRPASEPAPVAVNEKTARHLLGGISRSQLYRMLVRGEIDRMPNTRRLLITVDSITRASR